MSNIKPLLKSEHSDSKWRRYANYLHAKSDAVAPITVQEMVKASKVLPLCFIRTGEDAFVPAVIQSLVGGTNLLVAPDGRWMAPYVPACYRSFPFALGISETGERILCADFDSDLIGEEGDPLFEDGEPSKAVKEVFGFLHTVQDDREKAKRVSAVLNEHNLIAEWPLKIKTESGENEVKGIYRINEAALNALSAVDLAEVRDAGGLPVAYCQLLSMQNLVLLEQLAKFHAQAQQVSKAPDVEALFGEADDTLKFNFDDI